MGLFFKIRVKQLAFGNDSPGQMEQFASAGTQGDFGRFAPLSKAGIEPMNDGIRAYRCLLGSFNPSELIFPSNPNRSICGFQRKPHCAKMEWTTLLKQLV